MHIRPHAVRRPGRVGALLLAFLVVTGTASAAVFVERILPSAHGEKGVASAETALLRSVRSVTTYLARGSVGTFAYAAEVPTEPAVLGETTETPAYAATLAGQSHTTFSLLPGKAFTVWADFTNAGTATWQRTDEHFIALNVADPAGRESVFQHKFWNEYAYRPGRLANETVAPGEVGRVRFALQVPKDLAPGAYTETFGLVAEDLEWIPGGAVTFTIIIPENYLARFQEASGTELTLEPAQEKTVWVDFKNLGVKTWTNRGVDQVGLGTDEPQNRESQLQHRFWRSATRPNWLDQPSVRHGEIGRVRFAIKAPLTEGVYVEHFALVTEHGTWIPGGRFTLTLTVARQPVVLPGITGPGPLMRIGLFWKNAPVTVSADGSWSANDSAGLLLRALAPTEAATVAYDGATGVYTLAVGTETFTATTPIRFIPASDSVILSLESYEDPLGWLASDPYKRYRGIIEVQWAAETQRLWVINELPLESYLAGIAEAGNENPDDYLQTLIVAARSYAIRIWTLGTKHANENFTLDATFDQVYRGYNAELERPNVARATSNTRGEAVTFGGRVVLTPYFSHSDGRTRAWEEVWGGGPFPWLVSVPDPCCTAKRLFGHGVGMSALGARWFALQGKNYRDILQHYYPGTGLEAVY